jgi:hypothetical protein
LFFLDVKINTLILNRLKKEAMYHHTTGTYEPLKQGFKKLKAEE